MRAGELGPNVDDAPVEVAAEFGPVDADARPDWRVRRLDERAEVCQFALRLVGEADVAFESAVLPESPITPLIPAPSLSLW